MRIERSKRAGLGIAVGWICIVLTGLLAALTVPMAATGTLVPLAILVFGVGRVFVHLLAGSLWADFAFLMRGNQDRDPPHDWSKTGMD